MASSQEPIPGRTVLILYGSETGSAQDVAHELAQVAERLRFDVQISELNDASLVCAHHDQRTAGSTSTS